MLYLFCFLQQINFYYTNLVLQCINKKKLLNIRQYENKYHLHTTLYQASVAVWKHTFTACILYYLTNLLLAVKRCLSLFDTHYMSVYMLCPVVCCPKHTVLQLIYSVTVRQIIWQWCPLSDENVCIFLHINKATYKPTVLIQKKKRKDEWKILYTVLQNTVFCYFTFITFVLLQNTELLLYEI